MPISAYICLYTQSAPCSHHAMTTFDDHFLTKLRRIWIKVDPYFIYMVDIAIGMRGIHNGWSSNVRIKRMIFVLNREPRMSEDK